jgi:RimJ/RimL family protein N-acetyltransferase
VELTELAWPLRTDRLVLRPAGADDAEAVWRFRRLASVSEWLTRAPQTFEDHRSQFVDPASLAKTLLVERHGEVIGDLMVEVVDAWAQAEVADAASGTQANLGWALHPDATGHGYATEAVTAVLRLCFEELGVRRVAADCFADNEASWRLMERVGMRREGHAVADALHRSGRWLDSYVYALLVDEWRT